MPDFSPAALVSALAATLLASTLYAPLGPHKNSIFLASGIAVATAVIWSIRDRSPSSGRQFPAGKVIEYLTDIEGNWDYFQRLVQNSEILKFVGNELRMTENGILVFGGDAVDKGPGDIRVVKSLTALKKRHPDRVIFILGNRDVNKLRFTSELAPEEIGRPIDIYWDKKAKSYSVFCEESKLPQDSAVTMLKWMLACNMGSATTFETRRAELESLKLDASDEGVVKSFRDSVDKNGSDPWMLEFIRCGQIAAVVGDTLFLHGGISASQLGSVPNSEGGFDVAPSLSKWVEKLNEWGRQQLEEFETSPHFRVENGKRVRGAEGLMDYGLPGGAKSNTIMYGHWLENGNCKDLDEEVEDFLITNGIRRVFTGHQPHGDCPSVIRSPRGLYVVMCDTSYSDMKADKTANPANNRGQAFSVVNIDQDLVSVRGVLADGTRHGYVLGGDYPPDHLIGRKLQDGSWVKTIPQPSKENPNVLEVLTAKGEGFKLPVTRRRADEVMKELAPAYKMSQ